MKIDIKSSEDFIRFANEAICQETSGMTKAPSNQTDPRNIPKEGAELASLTAMHFFSFLCENAGLTDTKASFKEAFSHEATLLSAMESGTDFYEAICVLNRMLQLSQENKRLTDLQEFKQSLPSIEALRRSLTERFGEHINGVVDFLQRRLIFVHQPGFSSLEQIDVPNIPCGGSKEGMLKAGRMYSFWCEKTQIADSKFHIAEPCFQQGYLFPAMKAGIDYYRSLYFLDKIIVLFNQNGNFANLSEIKETLTAIEDLKQSTIKAFAFHVDGVTAFLRKQLAAISSSFQPK